MQRLTSTITLLSVSLLLASSIDAEELTTNLKLGADFRYRHELIDKDGSDQRNRERIRARIKLDANISDETSMTIQLASGGDDPASTNQTLDGGFSTKGINLDLAYITWKPAAVSGLTVTGGKVKNPFYTPGKTKLIWDSDLNPEGAAATYARSVSNVDITLASSVFWADERSAGDDAILLGLQGTFSTDIDGNGLVFGAGYFDYTNIKGNLPLYDTTDSFGNSLAPGGFYANDYNEFELFAELTPSVLDGNLTVFADVVNNIAEDADNSTAWLIGATAGSVKERGDMSLKYTFRRIEADAVVGIFTDSDFRGGGTDGTGHELNFSVGITPKIAFDATYYLNECGIGSDVTYHRVQADVVFKL